MKTILTILVFSITGLISSFQPAQPDTLTYEQRQFFQAMQALCGNSYSGEVVFPEEAPQGFTDPLVAHFTICEDNELHIPFHVGENTSRTWMFTLSDEGLLFKHDHRHPDGTPERMTNYGGWGDDRGDEFGQYFPADEETIALRDNLRSHIWKAEVSDDMSTFSYSLYIWENLYFRADFDLTSPI
jgi:hypothetical protein